MSEDPHPEVLVIGSGPNGLAAAITVARAGVAVRVLEAKGSIGGGARTEELTLPGFRHDVCSAIHPMAAASPFFRSLPLQRHGFRLIEPPVPLVHSFPDGTSTPLHRDLTRAAEAFGEDRAAWRNLFAPMLEESDSLFREILRPIRMPRHPVLTARFGLSALRSCR
ncbi:MAG: NAD(P)-binding protein, partial [Thermoanaerobaculia bacterium]|nr:NAD(P)-binding protein [Thermoanaerobaculia bacterium]